MRAATGVLIAVAPVNVLLNIALVYHTPLGFLGSPAAIAVTYWLCFLLLVAITSMSSKHRSNQTWGGFQVAVVVDHRSCMEFLKLAIPGILMVGTEWQVRLALCFATF